jgi:hypothetical protein
VLCRFDKFNLKYNPFGQSRLREIFIKQVRAACVCLLGVFGNKLELMVPRSCILHNLRALLSMVGHESRICPLQGVQVLSQQKGQ